jgi:hypothetical protein
LSRICPHCLCNALIRRSFSCTNRWCCKRILSVLSMKFDPTSRRFLSLQSSRPCLPTTSSRLRPRILMLFGACATRSLTRERWCSAPSAGCGSTRGACSGKEKKHKSKLRLLVSTGSVGSTVLGLEADSCAHSHINCQSLSHRIAHIQIHPPHPITITKPFFAISVPPNPTSFTTPHRTCTIPAAPRHPRHTHTHTHTHAHTNTHTNTHTHTHTRTHARTHTHKHQVPVRGVQPSFNRSRDLARVIRA